MTRIWGRIQLAAKFNPVLCVTAKANFLGPRHCWTWRPIDHSGRIFIIRAELPNATHKTLDGSDVDADMHSDAGVIRLTIWVD